MKLVSSIMFGIALLWLMPFASAQEADRVTYSPDLVLSPIPEFTQPQWFSEGQAFVDVPLVPRALFVTTTQIEAGGEVLVDAGTRFETMRSIVPVRCTLIPAARKGMFASTVRTCVADRDKDGQFETAWQVKAGAPAWEFYKTIPRETMAIINPDMEQISLDALTETPRFRIYSDHMALRRRPRDGSPPYWEAFVRAEIYAPGGGSSYYCLLQNGYCVGYRNKTLLGLGNLLMEVTKVDDERIQVRLLQNFSGERYWDVIN